MFVAHAITWAAFAPAAVLLLDRFRETDAMESDAADRRLQFGLWAWTWRLAAIAAIYVLIYVVFGALVAWRAPEVRSFYENVRMPGPGLIVLTQVGRGLLWAAIAVPVVAMMRGSRSQVIIATGVLFGVVMSAALLLPNPLLPRDVRMVHLVETVSSDFLFGLITAWILTVRGRAKVSARPRRPPAR